MARPCCSRNRRGHSNAGAGQPVRHAAPRGPGHGRRFACGAARSRQAARLPEGAGAAEGPEGCLGQAAGAQAGAQHGAEGGVLRALPGSGVGRQGRRPVAPAHPDLLAGRRRAAHHLGAGGHAGAAQDAAEPRHLPPAGDRARTRSSCAGCRIAAARWIFAIIARSHPGQPFPVAVALGADPATMLGRGDAGAGLALRVPVRRPAARRENRSGEMSRFGSAGAGLRRNRARRRDPPRRDGAGRAVRRPYRLLQRAGRVPGVHHRAHHHAPQPRSTTAPTPANRRTSRPCSAWR